MISMQPKELVEFLKSREITMYIQMFKADKDLFTQNNTVMVTKCIDGLNYQKRGIYIY